MTEYVHELRLLRVWDLGIVAKCDVQGCNETLGIMEVNRRLNEYEMKKATDALSKDYYELIMAVGNKHEGETRHETALRYIQEAERGSDTAYSDIPEGKE